MVFNILSNVLLPTFLKKLTDSEIRTSATTPTKIKKIKTSNADTTNADIVLLLISLFTLLYIG